MWVKLGHLWLPVLQPPSRSRLRLVISFRYRVFVRTVPAGLRLRVARYDKTTCARMNRGYCRARALSCDRRLAASGYVAQRMSASAVGASKSASWPDRRSRPRLCENASQRLTLG
jgi:hypothetical protein